MTLRALTLMILLGITTASSALADGPYRGRVIDAETKESIEGAAVVAVWTREVFAVIQSNQHFAYAHEVVTNENGEFEMPGMPWWRHVTLFLNPLDWLERGQPQFYILKPGYGWYPHYRVSPPKGRRQEKLEHFKKAVTVELPPWHITEETLESFREKLPRCPFTGFIGKGEIAKFIPEYIKYINASRRKVGIVDDGITCY